MRRVAALLLATLLAGCAGRLPAPVADGGPATQVEQRKKTAEAGGKYHTVRKGETLHGIALENGVDYRDLAAWNGIENANRIKVGQQLRVSPPAAAGAPVAPSVEGTEIRPVVQQGTVLARPLDDGLGAGAVAPAPSVPAGETPANSETLKRAPKGGKLPYSEQNLARLKAQNETPPAPLQLAVAAPAPAPVAAEKPAGEKPAAAPGGGDEAVEWAWPTQGKLIATYGEGGGETNKGIDLAGKPGDPVLAAAAGKIVYAGNGLRGYGNLVIVRHNAAFLSAYAHNSRILVKEGQVVSRGEKIAEVGNSDSDQPKLHFEVRHQGKPVDPLKYLPARR